jgi:hypothetical protein
MSPRPLKPEVRCGEIAMIFRRTNLCEAATVVVVSIERRKLGFPPSVPAA